MFHADQLTEGLELFERLSVNYFQNGTGSKFRTPTDSRSIRFPHDPGAYMAADDPALVMVMRSIVCRPLPAL